MTPNEPMAPPPDRAPPHLPGCMKCPQCGRQLTGVEYDWRDPEHYDGVSEWACFPCGYHRGRWSGKILEEGEEEPRYGRK